MKIEDFKTVLPKKMSCLSKERRPGQEYVISNFYVPTLSSKKENILKLRELFSHQSQEKENVYYRKKFQMPYSNNLSELFSKEPEDRSFKAQSSKVHPSYSTLQLRSKRANDFYNCKRKKAKEREL